MSRHEATVGRSGVPGHVARAAVTLLALALVLGSALTAGASVDEPEEETLDGTTPVVIEGDEGSGQGLEPVPDETDVAVDDDAVTADAASEPGVEVRSIEGTVSNITVDGDDDPVQDIGDPLPVVTAVEVDGEYYELPSEMTDTLATGDVVEVTVASDAGLAIEDALELAAAGEVDEAEVLAVEETGETTSDDATLAEGSVAHSLTVLPVYWSTGTRTDTTSLRTLANSARDYWQSQSDGDLTIPTINVRDWVQVSAPSSCSTDSMLSLYSRALTAHGVASPTGNSHVVVYFPNWSSCGWAGMATVGGGRIWINGTLVQDVLTHEFGHNLGLGHANTFTCVSGGSRVPLAVPVSGCTWIEYRDYADVMGTGMSNKTTGSLNTALADHLGYVSLTDVTTVPSGGLTVDLAPLTDVAGHRALRMTFAGGQLYVDYRAAVGRDTRWSAWAGVQVHLKLVDDRGIPTSYLLNMQPASGDFTTPSTVRPQLAAGQTWQLPGVDRALTVESVGSSARVTVDVGPVTRYVEQVYLDLFKREVDSLGLQTWTQALLNGTPRVEVSNRITGSTEYRTRLITASYQTYLGREPDAQGLSAWLGRLRAGMTIQEMEAGFLASPEYYGEAGGTNASWVRALYAQVLGRAASASEVSDWTGRLASSWSRNAVARHFLLSVEYLTTVVDQYYWEYLGRGLDPVGLKTWVYSIKDGMRLEAVIGRIIASSEYYAGTSL